MARQSCKLLSSEYTGDARFVRAVPWNLKTSNLTAVAAAQIGCVWARPYVEVYECCGREVRVKGEEFTMHLSEQSETLPAIVLQVGFPNPQHTALLKLLGKLYDFTNADTSVFWRWADEATEAMAVAEHCRSHDSPAGGGMLGPWRAPLAPQADCVTGVVYHVSGQTEMLPPLPPLHFGACSGVFEERFRIGGGGSGHSAAEAYQAAIADLTRTSRLVAAACYCDEPCLVVDLKCEIKALRRERLGPLAHEIDGSFVEQVNAIVVITRRCGDTSQTPTEAVGTLRAEAEQAALLRGRVIDREELDRMRVPGSLRRLDR